mmetsp:Transcript_11495/g.14226  ORF Transcript_11495/g.14226 Transcript_11495/m.14226 type:complete len:260 (-) Transcript_11495:10-789(-)
MDSALLVAYSIVGAIAIRVKTEFTLTVIVSLLQDCFFRETTRHWRWQAGKSRYHVSIVAIELFSTFCLMILGSCLEIVLAYHQSLPGMALRTSIPSYTTLLLEIVVLSLLMDTYFYWTHRILHHRRIFTSIHKLHHRSKVLTPFSATNFSTLEVCVMSLGLFGMLSLPYRFHLESVGYFTILGHLSNLYYHLGIELFPSWSYTYFPTKLLVSASYHEVHHMEPRYNFGLYFNYWDRLMGTIQPSFDELYASRWKTKTKE